MRCFVAVTVGPSITEAMAAELPQLRSAAERSGLRISWSCPEGWHATLKFLGDVEAQLADAVARRLSEVAVAFTPFPVEATGLMTLPHGARRPNVVALELSDDGRFSELARSVDEALAREGFERELRAFRPHVTVGRVRAPRGWRRFEPSIAARRKRSFGAGEVRAVTLYSSVMGEGPARYDAIATAALARAGSAESAPA